MNEPKTYELAETDYMDGMKYKDIAEKYNVTINTVKSWKTRYDWNKKGVHTKDKKVCTQKKSAEPIANEVKQVIDNPNLTDKQRLFCLYYSKSFNATRSYQKAYGCSYEVAMTNGSGLLRNTRVKAEVMRLKEERYAKAFLKPEDIFQKYMDIAFADITDYVEFGQEEKQVMAMYGPVFEKDETTGEKKPVTKIVNTVRFKESSEVDGSLISEVKQGKDGASIKLADRMKALDWLSSHMDLATEEQRQRVNLIRAQTDKLTGNNQEIEDLTDVDGEIYDN